MTLERCGREEGGGKGRGFDLDLVGRLDSLTHANATTLPAWSLSDTSSTISHSTLAGSGSSPVRFCQASPRYQKLAGGHTPAKILLAGVSQVVAQRSMPLPINIADTTGLGWRRCPRRELRRGRRLALCRPRSRALRGRSTRASDDGGFNIITQHGPYAVEPHGMLWPNALESWAVVVGLSSKAAWR